MKTFSPLEEGDVEATGGRLVRPETELELCDVDIWGLPQTACLFVSSNGTDDEFLQMTPGPKRILSPGP